MEAKKNLIFLEGYIPYTQKQTQWMFSAIIIFLFFGGFREENVPTFFSSLSVSLHTFFDVFVLLRVLFSVVRSESTIAFYCNDDDDDENDDEYDNVTT